MRHNFYGGHHTPERGDRFRWGGFSPGGFGPRERFGGRGPGGPGGPGERGGGRRGFAKGDLRMVVLSVIAREPRHGYDIIKALAEQSHGWYQPSPGSIYPLLQLLEDQGLVKATESSGKKVYSITEEGMVQVTEFRKTRQKDFDLFFGSDQSNVENLRGVMHDVKAFMPLVGRLRGRNDAETVEQFRAVLQKAKADLESILDTPPTTSV